MKDLYRCLDEYSPFLLEAVASAWGISLPTGEQAENVKLLAKGMLAPGALERLLHKLSPEAQGAFMQIARAGGSVPSHRITMHYGAIRRFGPARMAREQPWKQPASPLEEIYYAGLVYRAYGAVGQYYGEILLTPAQLFDLLPQSALMHSETTSSPVGQPGQVQDDGNALLEDMFAALVYLRHHRVRVQSYDLSSSWLDVERLDLGSRLLGSSAPDRLRLIAHLLARLKLLHVAPEGALKPSLGARDWLRLADQVRQVNLFSAWRDDGGWNELHLLPSLQCEETGWQSNPLVARRNLIAFLAAWPPETWFSLDDFCQYLKQQQPDYLRPDGDFDSWHIRDADTREYLSGFESWDAVEGVLARHIMTRPLFWLGLVRLGLEGEKAVSFAVTPRGQQLLSGLQSSSPEQSAPGSCLALVNEEMVVTIVLEGAFYDRYLLERFAEWRGQNERAVYHITADSVWKGVDNGVKIEQIIAFLKRITLDQVPPSVLRTLLAWGGRFGRASLQRAIILRTEDEGTMLQIQGQGDIQPLLRESLSPTAYLVEEEDVAELIRRLKALGVWPHVRL